MRGFRDLIMRFGLSPNSGGNYWVNSVVYNDYAIIYQCQEYSRALWYEENILVLSRTTNHDDTFYADKLEEMDIKWNEVGSIGVLC